MSTVSARATLSDLAKISEKAELIDGRIVRLMPTGHRPNRVAFHIARSLDDHAAATGSGIAYTDNIGFAVPELASGRESFSPDASFFTGSVSETAMGFPVGAPVFAVEVRSENDYGPAEERAMALKRSDYFEAGTQVVWDVDPRAEIIRAYDTSEPNKPRTFARGMVADAEPALPGWKMDVAAVFRP